MVHDEFSETDNLPSAYAIYTSLSLLASDHQGETFTVKKALIAYKAGVSITTAERILKRMEAIILIRVDRQLSATGHPEGANTYTLLRVGSDFPTVLHNEVPLLHEYAPMRHQQKQPFMPDKVEESRRIFEESVEEVGTGVASAADAPLPASKPAASKTRKAVQKTDAEYIAELKADAAYAGIDVPHEAAKMKRWCLVHGKQPTRRRFINWLNRVDRPLVLTSDSAKRSATDLRAGIDPGAFLAFFRTKYPRLNAQFSLEHATPEQIHEYRTETH